MVGGVYRMSERWTSEEDSALLARYRAGEPIAALAVSLYRTQAAVEFRLVLLRARGELSESRLPRWTADETEAARRYSAVPGRTRTAAKVRRHRMKATCVEKA